MIDFGQGPSYWWTDPSGNPRRGTDPTEDGGYQAAVRRRVQSWRQPLDLLQSLMMSMGMPATRGNFRSRVPVLPALPNPLREPPDPWGRVPTLPALPYVLPELPDWR